MKKNVILVCILAVMLNAALVSANVSPYLSSQVSQRPMMRLAEPEGCRMDIKTSPGDIRFVSKARQECIDMNRGNYRCQNKCFGQITMTLRRGATSRGIQSFSRQACKGIDPIILSGAMPSRCHFEASVECSKENPNNDWCRKVCVQEMYKTCRKNIFGARGGIN